MLHSTRQACICLQLIIPVRSVFTEGNSNLQFKFTLFTLLGVLALEFVEVLHGHWRASTTASHVCRQHGIIASIVGAIPPVIKNILNYYFYVLRVIVVEVVGYLLINICCSHIGNLVFDLLVSPVRILGFEVIRQIILFEFFLVDGRLKVHLKTKDISVSNGIANGIMMK